MWFNLGSSRVQVSTVTLVQGEDWIKFVKHTPKLKTTRLRDSTPSTDNDVVLDRTDLITEIYGMYI